MGKDNKVLWDEIRLCWGDLLDVFRAHLPTEKHVILKDGTLCPSNRPLLESIVCAYVAKDGILLEYIALVGCFRIDDHDIHISVGNELYLGQSGGGVK